MKRDEIFCNSFKALGRQLGFSRPEERRSMVEECRADDSELCLEMVSKYGLTTEQMLRAAQQYRLGKSRNGKTIFWMIDDLGIVRDGHIGSSWVSQMLKCRCPELGESVRPVHCLFGLHLLKVEGGGWRVEGEHQQDPRCEVRGARCESGVAVVESEKAAVVLSELFPHCLWMASGPYPTLNLLEPLRGCHVTLFPHTDPTIDNYIFHLELAEQARGLYHFDISVSSLLEDHASPEQKQQCVGLLEYLFHE